MARLKFGAFLAPHHPIGENPLLQFRRDLDFVEQIDTLGFDEFWCGEHHSSGWEMIASPEMFLAIFLKRIIPCSRFLANVRKICVTADRGCLAVMCCESAAAGCSG